MHDRAFAARIARKMVMTSGEVARLCNVAPRTVSKWFDTGRLKGYRIPGSQDRRFPREQVVRFMAENGIPLGPLEAGADPVILLVGVPDAVADRFALAGLAGWTVRQAADCFTAGRLAAKLLPACVVLDASLGRGVCLAAAAAVRHADPGCTLACLLADDDPGGGGRYDVEVRGGDLAPLVTALCGGGAA